MGKCDVVLELCVAVGLWVCCWRPSGSKSPNPYIHSVVRGPERFSGQEDGQSDKRSHHFPLPILSESEIVRLSGDPSQRPVPLQFDRPDCHMWCGHLRPKTEHRSDTT